MQGYIFVITFETFLTSFENSSLGNCKKGQLHHHDYDQVQPSIQNWIETMILFQKESTETNFEINLGKFSLPLFSIRKTLPQTALFQKPFPPTLAGIKTNIYPWFLLSEFLENSILHALFHPAHLINFGKFSSLHTLFYPA